MSVFGSVSMSFQQIYVLTVMLTFLLPSYIISTSSVFGGELGLVRVHESKVLVEDCLLSKDEQFSLSFRKVTAFSRNWNFEQISARTCNADGDQLL